MQLTEQNCPTLRFLKWTDGLDSHPEFVKARKGGKPRPFLRPDLTVRSEDREDFDSIADSLVTHWGEMSSLYRRDVWTASKAYMRAFDAASDSICAHREELYRELVGKRFCGCHAQAVDGCASFVLYDVTPTSVRKEDFPDGSPGLRVFWNGAIHVTYSHWLVASAVGFDDKVCEVAAESFRRYVIEANRSLSAGLLFQVLDQEVFRRYANVVTKDAKSPSSSKSSGKDDETVIKSTMPSVNRYDVSWYTEIVRSEGFPRRGYLGFRWKGPKGNRHKVLVPVRATFCKGYTRHARKVPTGVQLSDFVEK